MSALERSASARNLFPRRARLASKEDFARVFAGRLRVSDERFTVLARHNDLDYPRVGLGVPRKAIGKSVDRNRVKRIVREQFRLEQHDLPAIDIVVLARPGAGMATPAELRQSLQTLWHRVRTRCRS